MAGSCSELGNGRSSKAARFADPLAEDDAEGGLLQTKRESTYDMAEASMYKTMRLDEAPEATLKRAWRAVKLAHCLELVIDAALPMAAAIKQANDTMGLPSQGPLPQQVAALVAALGIRV